MSYRRLGDDQTLTTTAPPEDSVSFGVRAPIFFEDSRHPWLSIAVTLGLSYAFLKAWRGR